MPFKEREFFKIIGQDGLDLYAREFDYADCIGFAAYLPPCDDPRVCTDAVLHASLKLTDALRHVKFHGVNKYGYLRVLKVHGRPVCTDHEYRKYGFFEFDVLREVMDPEELVTAFMKENTGIWLPYSYGRGRSGPQPDMTRNEATQIVRKWFLCAGVH